MFNGTENFNNLGVYIYITFITLNEEKCNSCFIFSLFFVYRFMLPRKDMGKRVRVRLLFSYYFFRECDL